MNQIEAIMRYLNNDDPELRRRAIAAAGQMIATRQMSEAQWTPIISTSLKDEAVAVRLETAKMLAYVSYGRSEAFQHFVPELLSLLDGHDSEIRAAVALALGRIRSSDAYPSLVELLNDNESDVRKIAASALLDIDQKQAASLLVGMLASEDSDVRSLAIGALQEVGNDSQDDYPPVVQDISPVIELLTSPHENVRACAAWILVGAEDKRTVAPLIAALSDKNNQIRQNAARALGRQKDTDAVEPLIALLKDDSLHIRLEVIEALGRLRDERAAPSLIQTFKRDNDLVAQHAAEALNRIGVMPSYEELLAIVFGEKSSEWAREGDFDSFDKIATAIKQRVDTAHSDVYAILGNGARRREAIAMLGRAGGERAVGPLVSILQNKAESRQMLEAAIDGLAATHSIHAVAPLISFFEREDYGYIHEVSSALARLADVGFDTLLEMANSSNDKMREVAVRAMRSSQRAFKRLLQALSEDNGQVRLYAASSLSAIDPVSAVEPIALALNDESAHVRVWLVRNLIEIAIKGISIEKALPKLLELQEQDPNHEVRQAAAIAAGKVKERHEPVRQI